MTSTFEVSTVINQINTYYLAKPNLYTILIGGGGKVPDISSSIALNCSAVSIPGININTHTEHRRGIGQNITYPNQRSFTELMLTFYESDYEQEKAYFSNWINSIVDPNSGQLGWFSDYSKTVVISQYNRKQELTYQCMLGNAYPINLGGLDRGYSHDNQFSQFTVGLTFYQMQEVFYQQPLSSLLGNISNPLLPTVASIIKQTIGSLI
jgi:hypothetical protein